MLKNLLLYRLGIFNISMSALLGFLAYKGYISMALAADPTGICVVIAAMWVVVACTSAKQAWSTAKGLNFLKSASAPQLRVPPPGKPWTKRMVKIEHIHEAAGWMAYIGLMGTLIGFILAMGALDWTTAGTASGVTALVPQMLNGMGIAIWTTLTGSFFGLWTEINSRMIRTATFTLVEDEKAQWDA